MGVHESGDYLTLSMSISVGPFPPSAVPFSPQAAHTSSPAHVMLIYATKHTLPAFPSL